MTRTQIQDNLVQLVEQLPKDKVKLLLDFASYLRQQADSTPTPTTADEEDLIRAEDYWFDLPSGVREQYKGKTVAVADQQILDSDSNLTILRRRTIERFPEYRILYIDASAEREPILVLRSPHLE